MKALSTVATPYLMAQVGVVEVAAEKDLHSSVQVVVTTFTPALMAVLPVWLLKELNNRGFYPHRIKVRTRDLTAYNPANMHYS